MEIMLQVPDSLGEELKRNQHRLVEIIERGLESVTAENPLDYSDENSILEVLVNQPEPGQVIALKPSSELQARVSFLLQQSKERKLTPQEDTELNRYLWLEHLVRLAKAHAAKKLASKP